MAKNLPHGWGLGLDVGSDSIGWVVYRLAKTAKPDKLIDGGVRLFDGGREPKKKTSFAKDRGIARRARRRLRAKKWRRDALTKRLVAAGLAPPNTQVLDIWAWRKRAATEAIDPPLLGAVLQHILRHRGFKSPRLGRALVEEEGKIAAKKSRKAKAVEDAEDTEAEDLKRWASAEKYLRERMRETGAPTVGALLADELKSKGFVRARRGFEDQPLPTRPLIREEIDQIGRVQAARHGIGAAAWSDIADTILDQRPLRDPRPGRCTFHPEDERLPRCLPTAQRFRIRQSLCNLRIAQGIVGETRALTAEEFAIIDGVLAKGGAHTWPSLREAIGLPKRGVKFTIEIERASGQSKKAAKEIDGDESATVFATIVPGWSDMAIGDRDLLVGRLRAAQRDRKQLLAIGAGLGLTAAAADTLADAAQFNLPRGYLSLGLRAVTEILPHLIAGTPSDQAFARGLGRSHSDLGPTTLLPSLPYYGEVLRRGVLPCNDGPEHERRTGRVGNVTVHVALNEIRKVVNALIERHGPPARAVIETTRELKADAKRLREIEAEQKKREEENEAFTEEYGESLAAGGRKGKGGGKRMSVGLHEARKRIRLARRQGNVCPYTAQEIGRADLFTEAYEIDHVIPREIGGDVFDNLVLCVAESNRKKRDRTPYEAFHDNTEIWNHVADMLKRLPETMHWRFGPEARQRAEGEGDDGGWVPRQIRDTSYIARMVREYLTHVAKEVWTTKGRLTGLLRSAWDLPVPRITIKDPQGVDRDIPRKRLDHRHHFVDAAVIAVTSRSIVQAVNTLSARGELKRAYEADITPPYKGFAKDVGQRYERIWPSIRPDHSLSKPSGALHNETLYGIKADGEGLVRRTERVGVEALFKSKATYLTDEKADAAIQSFVSEDFRRRFMRILDKHRAGASCLAEAAIKACADTHWGPRGIGEIKCWKDDTPRAAGKLKRIPRGPERDANRPAIEPNANAWLAILRNGKKWDSAVVTKFEAATATIDPTSTPNLVFLLRRGDIVAWERNGRTEYGWLKVIKATRKEFYVWPLRLSETMEATALRPDLNISKRDGIFFSPETFRKAGGRKCTVSVLGRLRDPGPPKE